MVRAIELDIHDQSNEFKENNCTKGLHKELCNRSSFRMARMSIDRRPRESKSGMKATLFVPMTSPKNRFKSAVDEIRGRPSCNIEHLLAQEENAEQGSISRDSNREYYRALSGNSETDTKRKAFTNLFRTKEKCEDMSVRVHIEASFINTVSH